MRHNLTGKHRVATFLLSSFAATAFGQEYDIVIANGRVIDPATGLDGGEPVAGAKPVWAIPGKDSVSQECCRRVSVAGN